jgi:hypothetical protein
MEYLNSYYPARCCPLNILFFLTKIKQYEKVSIDACHWAWRVRGFL